MAHEDRTPHPAEDAGSIPRRSDGTINLARIAAGLSLELHPIGSAIVACATYLAFLDEITPRRGEQRDLLDQAAASLARTYELTLYVDLKAPGVKSAHARVAEIVAMLAAAGVEAHYDLETAT